MKVKELMTADPQVCKFSDSLADAAGLMWENDCGILPVVSEDGKVVGLITDRDICMAAALKGRQPGDIAIEETISGNVYSCRPDDDVRTALKTMQENRVHRLAVVNAEGTLAGVMSMNDVVLKAEEPKDKKVPALSYSDVVNTYKAICRHRLPIEQTKAATV